MSYVATLQVVIEATKVMARVEREKRSRRECGGARDDDGAGDDGWVTADDDADDDGGDDDGDDDDDSDGDREDGLGFE